MVATLERAERKTIQARRGCDWSMIRMPDTYIRMSVGIHIHQVH